MADVQIPTEASLFSSTNPAPEYTVPVSKEASTQVSFAANTTQPAETQTTVTMNGDSTHPSAKSIPSTSTMTNGVVPEPTPTSIPTSLQQQQQQPSKAMPSTDEEPPLFSPSLISPVVSSLLPQGYTLRPLRRSDYYGGFLDTLRVLTAVGEPTLSEFNARYDFMYSRNDTYYVLVICDGSGTIVGTGAVIVERKFIHNMGLVGHIEDIAVAKNQQGKKLGLRIIQALDYVAENVGCYKCILDCSEANEGFYVKCGFKRAGLEMAHYYETAPKI
ncbi:Glucosamine-phosphate N-acetyltransferase-like protein [Rhinocladiella similis]